MTQTERELQVLRNSLTTYMDRLDTARSEIDVLRKSCEKLTSQLETERTRVEVTLEKLRDATSGLQTQTAVHASSLDDLKKRWEESERRRWAIFGVGLAAVLSLVTNLVLLFLRK